MQELGGAALRQGFLAIWAALWIFSLRIWLKADWKA